jgi:hypothetical protein
MATGQWRRRFGWQAGVTPARRSATSVVGSRGSQARTNRLIGSPGGSSVPAPAPPDLRVRVRRSQMPMASMLIARRSAQRRQIARLDAALEGCQSGEAQPVIVKMAAAIDFGCPKV